MVAVGLAGAVIAYLLAQSANGSLVLPAALSGALAIANVVLGWFSGSAMAPAPAVVPAALPAPGVQSAVAAATATEAAELQKKVVN